MHTQQGARRRRRSCVWRTARASSSPRAGRVQANSYTHWLNKLNAGNLPKGQFIFINNKQTAIPTDLGIRIFVENKNKFALRASGGFLNPDYQNIGNYSGVAGYIGVFNSNEDDLGSLNLGDIIFNSFINKYVISNGINWETDVNAGVWTLEKEQDVIAAESNGRIFIRNGLHYQVIAWNEINFVGPENNTDAYQLLPKSAPNVGYIEEWDDVEYDFDNNWIQSRKDKRGNEVKVDLNTYGSMNTNPFTAFQWGNNGITANSILNSTLDCLNTSANTDGGRIKANILNSIEISIANTSTVYDFEYNSLSWSCTGDLFSFGNLTRTYSKKTLSPHLSTFDAVINCDTALSGGILTVPDYVGIVILDGTSNPTISNFTPIVQFERYFIFTDNNGLSAVIFDNIGSLKFPSPSTGTTLIAAYQDFIKFKRVNGNIFIQTASEQY